jgi:hypothetical protein
MKLLVLGHARHGKDTAAEMLQQALGLTFCSSSKFAAEHVVRPALALSGIVYPSIGACFEDRVHHRKAWYEAIVSFNRDDPARLGRMIFGQYDVYVGLRSRVELQALREAKLFDLCLWIDANGRGVPPEPLDSCSVTAEDADVVVPNDGTLEQLRERLVAVLHQRLNKGGRTS